MLSKVGYKIELGQQVGTASAVKMENTSLSGVVWDNTTTSSPESNAGGGSNYHSPVRDRVLKIVYTIIGTLGIVDNLFVLIVFILFIKITEKVSDEYFRVYQ